MYLDGSGSGKLSILTIVLSIKNFFHKLDNSDSSLFSILKNVAVADNFSSEYKILAIVCLISIFT